MDGAPVVIVLGPAAIGASAAERAEALLAASPGTRLVVCDVAALLRPGPADLNQLGRLRMATRRRGCGLVLRNAGVRLRLLLELTGLDEVFVCEGAPAADGADPAP